MAEQLAVEIDVKNVMEDGQNTEDTGQAPLLQCLMGWPRGGFVYPSVCSSVRPLFLPELVLGAWHQPGSLV